MMVDLEQKKADIDKYEEAIYYSPRYSGKSLAFKGRVLVADSAPPLDDEYEYRFVGAIASQTCLDHD